MDNLSLDQTLLELPTPHGVCNWTIRHAVEGCSILGGIGSGKTTGSGKLLALKYLRKNFGGLVLTVKPDEREMWEEYCQMANRSEDLIIVKPKGGYFFNFLDYELQNSSDERSSSDNIVQVLKTVIKAGEEKSNGRSDDPFWEASMDLLLYHVIDLCILAYEKVSVKDMLEIVQTIPKSTDSENAKKTDNADEETTYDYAFNKAIVNAQKKLNEWKAKQKPEYLIRITESGEFDSEAESQVAAVRLMKQLDQFFNSQYYSLSEKTRSIIDFTFSSFLFRLLREPVYSIFCKNQSTFSPDDCLDGKIILLDFPVKLYNKVGRDVQVMFKYIWQRAMEKRDVRNNPRPLFLWADEAQNFIHEEDTIFQATARSSRICTVYISQNLPNYYASMGGQKAKDRVDSFFGTLATKIFHANADISTNNYASALIGEGIAQSTSETDSMGQNQSYSETRNISFQRKVRPEEFIMLRTGGPNCNFKVDGIIHYQGNLFAKGLGYGEISFNQNIQ